MNKAGLTKNLGWARVALLVFALLLVYQIKGLFFAFFHMESMYFLGSFLVLCVARGLKGDWGERFENTYSRQAPREYWRWFALLVLIFILGHLYFDFSQITGSKKLWHSDGYRIARGAFYALATFGLVRLSPKKPRAALTLALPLFCFYAMDYAMALEPEWHSTVYPFIYITNASLMAFAFHLASLEAPPKEKQIKSANIFLAILLLNFWANFSQFLIIWIANEPSEVKWYVLRSEIGPGWTHWLWPCLLYGASFFLLLFRKLKANLIFLKGIAFFTLLGALLQSVYFYLPAYRGDTMAVLAFSVFSISVIFASQLMSQKEKK